ncbi:MAG TPA: hypothetical protein PKA00_19915 [Saprospiraceae bacterium]|nr:hypothetical protein [Saprospiraceae bacterium]HMQ85187.1 hypothetical protein [Saprospiraceae bacterium]
MMNADWTLLRIRYHQLRWEIRHLGLFSVLILGLILLLQFLCFDYFQRLPDAYLVVGIAWGALLSIHFSRQDLSFVYSYLEKPVQALCWEYGCYGAIFCWPALLTPHWYGLFLIALGGVAVAWIRPYQMERTPMRYLGRVLSSRHFEWISGIRRFYPLVLGLYLSAWIFYWVRVLPLVLLWLLTVVLCSFFSHNEPLNILREDAQSSRHLLWRKLGAYGQMQAVLYLPICGIQYVIFPDLWLFAGLFVPVQLSLLAASIFYKYATYLPNRASKSDIVLALVGLSGVLPFLLPIPFCFAVIYFFRAQKRLNYFFK